MFESKDYATITVSHENQVTEICLNRPEKLNSFNVEMHEEIEPEKPRFILVRKL